MSRDRRLAAEAMRAKDTIYRFQQMVEEAFISAGREDATAHAEFYAQVVMEIEASKAAMLAAHDMLVSGSAELGVEPLEEGGGI